MLREKAGRDGGTKRGRENAGWGSVAAPSPALFSSSSGTSRSRKRLAGNAADGGLAGELRRAAASLGCGRHVYGRLLAER